MRNKINIKEIKKEKKKIESELSKLAEREVSILKSASFVPSPKGGFLEERKISAPAQEQEEEGDEDEDFAQPTFVPRMSRIEDFIEDNKSPSQDEEENDEEKEREKKEKEEDKYKMKQSREDENQFENPVDSKQAISGMMKKGMFLGKDYFKEIGLRGARTKFSEIEERTSAMREGDIGETPMPRIEKPAGLETSSKYESSKERDMAKFEEKAGKIRKPGKATYKE